MAEETAQCAVFLNEFRPTDVVRDSVIAKATTNEELRMKNAE